MLLRFIYYLRFIWKFIHAIHGIEEMLSVYYLMWTEWIPQMQLGCYEGAAMQISEEFVEGKKTVNTVEMEQFRWIDGM